MAGYGSLQRSRKSFGSRRGMRRSKPSRGSRYGYKKTGTTFKPRFATVGFNRDIEKKYNDKALITYNPSGYKTGTTTTADSSDGFMFISSGWAPYDFRTPTTSLTSTSNDLLKGITQGTTTTTRIGNKITGKYLKGCFTLGAAKLAGPSAGATNGDMNGEAIATASNATSVYQYLRTSWRVVIVKDVQVNNTDPNVTWQQVFESDTGNVGRVGGIHAELNISNMGRFRVLYDTVIKTDAVCPQESVPFMISGKHIGQVRYNGPDATSLTDKGIYVIWAAYVSGSTVDMFNTTEGLVAPTFTMHSRLAFTDD